ncbi:DNA-binding transcriptional regulator OxyR [Aestuariicella hydrocarbonica]|uniref:DNA-binding transcriptional regulator OxyR n=1 Tax=Pseudomaricurvus hydrocarbonicus TaxID=1470433 RepID=A0A9E5MNP1_9GAMM|nr:DNA-binding transcriptional regulator OxyR [Aestuariicella hydrocarbonica]NHO67512.1 DNA-binding transcriptional regulator OxyR [Aestuariicella hydrocarbonica]
MIKLRDLEYLVAIDEHKHFGRAAEACFVSQPTLSGQIIKLEDQLSLQLVERHRRSVMLTPAGETLIAKARKVLQAAEEFESTAKSLLDPLAGDLHVGMIPTLAPYLLPHIMPGLNRALPNIHFYLHENKTHNLLQELNGGKLDVLILPYLEDMDHFERYDLFEEELLLAVPRQHPFANKDQVTLDDLQGEQILTLEDGHCLRDQALGYCFSAGAHEDNRFQATSLETLRYMVASGLGMTLLPKLATLNQQPDNNLHYIPFSDPAPTRNISLVIRPNYSRMEAVRAVVSDVRVSLSKLSEL